MKHSFQILDIRKCKKMIPERREANKVSHMIAQHIVRSFQATAQGGGSLEEPSSLPEWTYSWQFGKAKATRAGRAEYWREETAHIHVCTHIHAHTCTHMHIHTRACTHTHTAQRFKGGPSWFFIWEMISVCMWRNYSSWGKNHWKGLEGIIHGDHKGWGQGCAPTN